MHAADLAAPPLPARTPRDVQDPFADPARKLASLFGLDRSARVLLLGDGPADWAAYFSSCFAECVQRRALGGAERGGCSLVVWRVRVGDRGLARDLRRVRDLLAPHGTLLLLAENGLAPRRMARGAASLARGEPVARWQWTRLLRAAGFPRVDEFAGFPTLGAAEEYVGVRPGWRPALQDGFAYVASGAEGGTRGLLRELGGGLAGGRELRVERFALRLRGALILVLDDVRSGRRLVCRVTTSPEVEAVVGRNLEWTRRIHAMPGIDPQVKRLVPRPLGTRAVTGGVAHLEELMEGTIAWKAVRDPGLARAVTEAMNGFLLRLVRHTGRPLRMTPEAWARLAGAECPTRPDPALDPLLSALRERSLGGTRLVAASHGDFGFGNVLADPATGALTGVIDWDQAREDLAGIDLLNFAVQRHRRESRGGVADALRAVAARFVAGGFEGIAPGAGFDAAVPTSADERRQRMAWLVLRLAQRDACYPRMHRVARPRMLENLGWALALLEEG